MIKEMRITNSNAINLRAMSMAMWSSFVETTDDTVDLR